MSDYTRQKAKSKYRNRIQLERASQKQSSDTHKTPYDRAKLCRERKINIKASERVNSNSVRSPAGSLPDFRTWGSWRTMPLFGGFSRGSPVSPAPSFCCCSILTPKSPSSALKNSLGRGGAVIRHRRTGFDSRLGRSRIFARSRPSGDFRVCGREARGMTDKGDTALSIKCVIVAKRKALNWRAVFSRQQRAIDILREVVKRQHSIGKYYVLIGSDVVEGDAWMSMVEVLSRLSMDADRDVEIPKVSAPPQARRSTRSCSQGHLQLNSLWRHPPAGHIYYELARESWLNLHSSARVTLDGATVARGVEQRTSALDDPLDQTKDGGHTRNPRGGGEDKDQLIQACHCTRCHDKPFAACVPLTFSRLKFCFYLKNVLVLIILASLESDSGCKEIPDLGC
ncbi:hypothetical protein PR048_022271 [Dryococelus australis]|uniref:Uncharacterized protein n=1 Tax=Dryococelus australis TaxID=614101 RepID=A0ABQ9H0J7_9NEOP|nr:hypothetical protein PR048_022271 [Dryococelus australis]